METKNIETACTNPDYLDNEDNLNSTPDKRKNNSCKNVNFNTSINSPRAQTCFVTDELLSRIYKNSSIVRKFKWLPKRNKLRHEVRSMLLESLGSFRIIIVKAVSTYVISAG